MCKRMKMAKIKKIADRIARKFRMPPVIAESCTEDGRTFVAVRSELTLDDGGHELISSIFEKLHYYATAMGGCVYYIYQD